MIDNKIVLLDYSFMFSPEEGWDNLYKFESDLIDFFIANKFNIQIIKTVEGGQTRRVMYLTKIPDKMREVIQKNAIPQNQQAGIRSK